MALKAFLHLHDSEKPDAPIAVSFLRRPMSVVRITITGPTALGSASLDWNVDRFPSDPCGRYLEASLSWSRRIRDSEVYLVPVGSPGIPTGIEDIGRISVYENLYR